MDANLQFSAFLLTYGIHSSLLIGGAWLLVRLVRPRSPEVREWLWKTALVGGIFTAMVQCWLPVPHWGKSFSVAPSSPSISDPIRTSDPAPAGESAGLAPGVTERVFDGGSDRGQPGWVGWAGDPSAWLRSLPWMWLAVGGIGLIRLGRSWLGLHRLRHGGRRIGEGELGESARGILRNLGSARPVEIWIIPSLRGPMAAGLFRWKLFLPEPFLKRLDRSERDAMIAHELAHLVRGDAWWLAAGQLISCLFFFQPLNRVARRHLRSEAEFLADRRALEVLPDEVGLARSLVALGEWLIGVGREPVFHPLATGMGACRSTLGKRIEMLLQGGRERASAGRLHRWAGILALSALTLTSLGAPRAVGSDQTISRPSQLDDSMKHTLTNRTVALVAGASLLAAAPAPAETEKPAADKPAATETGTFPETLHGFSGHLSGKLLSKDVEAGSLVMRVDKLLNVWKGNKATEPKDVVGRTLAVTGIHGKALDVLVVLKPEDHLEIETKHVSGDGMVYLGEGIKKVSAPAESGEKVPNAEAKAEGRAVMHGFRGMFVGKLVAKDQEKGTLEVKIERITKLWKQNTAKNAEAAAGQTWKINSVSGKWLDTLLTLKVGDRVEVEAFHHGGDELKFVGEWLKKAEDEPARDGASNATGGREDLSGFKGILIGKLLSKDVEKGTVAIEVETVKTVFKKSAAPRPESAIGQTWNIRGISGKFLDALLVINAGERIELAAFHNGGDVLDFPGEMLRKAE